MPFQDAKHCVAFGEMLDGIREIGVGFTVAGNLLSQQWDDAASVKVVEWAEEQAVREKTRASASSIAYILFIKPPNMISDKKLWHIIAIFPYCVYEKCVNCVYEFPCAWSTIH